MRLLEFILFIGSLCTLILAMIALVAIMLLLLRRPMNWWKPQRAKICVAFLSVIVFAFWCTPWAWYLGRRRAEEKIRKYDLLIVSLPQEVRDLPANLRPHHFEWGKVMEAETGVKVDYRPDNALSWEERRGFQDAMEKEVKRRFGDDIFLRAARKSMEQKVEGDWSEWR